MELPNTVLYALRAAAQLALAGPEERIPSQDLSEATQVPVHYLSKVLRRMVEHGLLDSKKGHHGGFRLTRPPGEITVGEVLAAVDYGGDDQQCGFGWGACDPEDPCPLHPLWDRFQQCFGGWAHHTTLADVQGFEDVEAS